MPTSRQYQIDYENALREGFKTHTRQIMALSTGGGKTHIFTRIVEQAALKGKRCLILTDRIELFRQTLKPLQNSNVSICQINKDNRMVSTSSLVFLAMVETFKRRMSTLSHLQFDLIIADEAHKSAFFPILDAYPNVPTIGATATPINKRLHKYYTNLVQLIDVPELIEQGFLCPCVAYQMQDDVSDIAVKSNGEFEDESHFKHFNKSKLYDGVIDKWLEKTPLKKTLVYCVNIKHAEHTSESFNQRGIKTFCITSKTPDVERAFILFEFSKNRFPVLVNCGCLTAGFDDPSVEVIVINRAISVESLFIQIVGRGARPLPGKNHFTVIDFGMNHNRHGLWEWPRKWTLTPPKKDNKPLGVAPIKICTQCGAVIPALARVCQHCQYAFPIGEKSLLIGQLVEVTPTIPAHLMNRKLNDLTVSELIDLEKTKRYKAGYIWRIVRTKGEEALGEYAEAKGYKDGWVRNQLEMLDAGGSVGFSNATII